VHEEEHRREHKHAFRTEKELKTVILLTSFILVAEIFGGIISNSLALLSDAAHVFSDLFALTLSWTALKIAERPPSTSRTFGYHRMEIFAALTNGILLVVISIFIFREAYERILSPPLVKGGQMLVIATIGLIVNLWVIFKLKGHISDLNIKSAFLHALGDAMASIGVIVGAVIIMFTGYFRADPAISILIGLIILVGSGRLIRESSHILLEGTPRHIDVKKVSEAIATIDGVRGVHDLHIWSICSHINAASAHVLVEDVKVSEIGEISREIKERMAGFDIGHTTIEFECGEGEPCTIKHW
jgi:cobalt-zinc-cadmium efflux system protein